MHTHCSATQVGFAPNWICARVPRTPWKSLPETMQQDCADWLRLTGCMRMSGYYLILRFVLARQHRQKLPNTIWAVDLAGASAAWAVWAVWAVAKLALRTGLSPVQVIDGRGINEGTTCMRARRADHSDASLTCSPLASEWLLVCFFLVARNLHHTISLVACCGNCGSPACLSTPAA